MKEKTWKRLLIFPPVVLGILVLFLIFQGREAPEQAPLTETKRVVRVIETPVLDVLPRALGYGYAQPGKVWEGVAQVGGQIVDIHPDLKKGQILPADTALLRIDPTDYRLAIARIEAGIRSVHASLAELMVKEANAQASIKIEERALKLGEKELARKRRLLKQGTVPQSAVDQEEKNMLGRRQSVQNLKNTLNLFPSEREVLEANLALYQAQLEEARLDLRRTTITLPFDGRIAKVNVERSQFAKVGQVLVMADSIDVAEVSAQVPIYKMRHLIKKYKGHNKLTLSEMGQLPELLGLSATVRLRSGDFTVEWDSRFTRISDTVDPKTRTIGVIVAVDDPYKKARPGIRPPLIKNMFVEVEVRGKARPARIVIPRSALRDGHVYVVNKENRLEKRPVKVEFFQTNFAAIEGGLSKGEKVIISDLLPAMEGMLLDPVPDEAALKILVAEALGEGLVK